MVKKMLLMFAEEIWKYVVRNNISEYFEELFRESMRTWIEKHLTPEEIKNEISDFGKWIREKL